MFIRLNGCIEDKETGFVIAILFAGALESYFFVVGKPEWCRRINGRVGRKGGFLLKRQSPKVFLIGPVRC